MTERLISAQELAKRLGVHKYHIRRLIQEERIPRPDFVVGEQEIRGWFPSTAKHAEATFHRLRRS